MSKYTAEQVLYAAQLEEDTYDGDLIIVQYLRAYAALLRERESAKAGVTHTMIREAKDAYENSSARDATGWWRSALEAVAPMLSSTRVPDELKSTPASPLHPLWGDGYLRGWNACRDAMLAAAPKPETIWPKNAREKAFSLAREMLKKGSAKPEKE